MGEVEYVYELKVDSSGKITGNQRMPIGDPPIMDCRINGNEFELKVQTEFLGNLQVATVKGTIEGATLKLTPPMPGPGAGGGPLLSSLLTAVHCHRRHQPAPRLRPLHGQQS